MVKVETYEGELTEEIIDLAKSYEYKPFHYMGAAKEEGLQKLFLGQVGKFHGFCAQQPENGAFFIARDDSGKLAGFTGAQTLDFDSAVLNVPSGRIPFFVLGPDMLPNYPESRPVADALVNTVLDWLKGKGIVFTNIRTAALELPLIHALENSGFYLVDNAITVFFHKDKVELYEKGDYDIRLFADKDLPTVIEIISDAYTQDRFHLDPNIPHDRSEELYKLWIEHNCVNPKDQEWVLIAERKGLVKGFFQYEYQREFSEATGIGLYSYGLAAVVRDRTALGAYSSMLSFAVNDSIMRGGAYGMTRIPFGIQSILRLMLRLGPSFMTNELSFHHWRK